MLLINRILICSRYFKFMLFFNKVRTDCNWKNFTKLLQLWKKREKIFDFELLSMITDLLPTSLTTLFKKNLKKKHSTFDFWYVTQDSGQVRGSEPSLKMAAPYLLRLGFEGVRSIYSHKMTQLMNWFITEIFVLRWKKWWVLSKARSVSNKATP